MPYIIGLESLTVEDNLVPLANPHPVHTPPPSLQCSTQVLPPPFSPPPRLVAAKYRLADEGEGGLARKRRNASSFPPRVMKWRGGGRKTTLAASQPASRAGGHFYIRICLDAHRVKRKMEHFLPSHLSYFCFSAVFLFPCFLLPSPCIL